MEGILRKIKGDRLHLMIMDASRQIVLEVCLREVIHHKVALSSRDILNQGEDHRQAKDMDHLSKMDMQILGMMIEGLMDRDQLPQREMGLDLREEV